MKIQVDETIQEMLSGGSASTIDRARMSEGPKVFNKEDIRRSKNDLDLTLRYLFDSMNIGKTYLGDKAVEYYQTVKHRNKEKAKSDTQNLIRTLEKGKITFNRFEEALNCLNFEIVDHSITIRDDVGQLHTFSRSQALAACK